MYTLEQLQQKNLAELKEIGSQLDVLPAGDRRCRQSWIDALVPPPRLQLLEDSPAASVEPVSEAIARAAENSSGVEVAPVSEPIEVQAQEAPIESKFGRIVYPRPAQGVIAQAAETAPGVEVDRVQEPIMETVETSPGVDLVDDEWPGCCNCFGDGYVEDEFGFVKFCQCETEPRLSHKRTQRAIELATKNSLKPKSDRIPILTGIPLCDRFLARYSPPQSETLHYELTDGYKVDTDGQLSLFEVQVVTEPEPPDPDDFESLEAFREAIALWEAQNPQPLNGSLDSMCEWAPCPHEWYEPKAENLPLKASSMIELPEQSQVMELLRGGEICSDTLEFFIPTFGSLGDRFKGRDEPPDTGIFARLPNPKPPKFPPQVSLSQPQVSPSQPQVDHKSATSRPQVGHKSATSRPQVEHKLNRHPETTPKLLHRIAAGSSTQPARSPPGGDAMS